MPLSHFMTSTAKTQRADVVSGKKGDPVTYLESVKIQAPFPPTASGQQAIREMVGIEGSAVQIYECYTESHAHTEDSVSVNKVPDIVRGDLLITGGITYRVQWAKPYPATSSFGVTLAMYLTESERG